MSSGTPLLTTRLPGMPADYYPYVYLFDDETTEAMTTKLNSVLTKSEEELEEKGKAAKKFVFSKKNKKRCV